MEDNSVDYVILEQLGYHSTEKYLFPAVQKYEPYFPRVLHINNPFSDNPSVFPRTTSLYLFDCGH